MKIKSLFILLLTTSLGFLSVSAQTETQVKQISKGVVNGSAINLPKPAYPPAALAVKAGGAVNVQVLIDEQGNVIEAKSVSGHPLLRQAAEQAALQAKFKPTLLSGQPVKVSGVIVYNFVPGEKPSLEKDSKTLIWSGIALFLTAAQESVKETDDEFVSLVVDISDTLSEDFAEEKAKLKDLSGANIQKRKKILGEVSFAFERKLQGTEKWAYSVGKNWGDAFNQSLWFRSNNSAFNETKFRTSLDSMKTLLKSAPNDLASETLQKLNKISSAADGKTDMPVIVEDFLNASEEFIDLMEANAGS